MSSLTICTIVCGDSQPCCLRLALNTRTFAVPGLRAAREVQEAGRQRRPGVGTVQREFLRGHPLVEHARERLGLRLLGLGDALAQGGEYVGQRHGASDGTLRGIRWTRPCRLWKRHAGF